MCAIRTRTPSRRLGSLDIVVNNAAVTTSMVQGGMAGWRRILEVNLLGPQLVAAAAADRLRASPAGTIINVSSLAALRGLGLGRTQRRRAG